MKFYAKKAALHRLVTASAMGAVSALGSMRTHEKQSACERDEELEALIENAQKFLQQCEDYADALEPMVHAEEEDVL